VPTLERCPRGRAAILAALLTSSLAARAAGAAPSATETATTSAPTIVAPPAEPRPPRLFDAFALPRWLAISIEHRQRYEAVAQDFRATTSGSPSGFALRTSAKVVATPGPFTLTLELLDAHFFASEGTPINTSYVNPIDVLQARAGLRLRDVLVDGDTLDVDVGRRTIDFVNRRVIARNEFRNTINAFDGLELRWASAGGHEVRAFGVVPVLRRPSSAEALAAQDAELDATVFEAPLVALGYQSPALWSKLRADAYVVGYFEGDSVDAPSTNRRLVTPGLRLTRPRAAGELDLEVELILQVGRSRATSAKDDTTDLDHRAASIAAAVGYTFDLPATPRLSLIYDFASGDGDPKDAQQGRFDPLFGARRFDLGVTGLFGPLARANLNSPGVRLDVRGGTLVEAHVLYRLAWLASGTDTWVAAGIRDASGASGDFVGQLVDGRLRLHLQPRVVMLELGAAALARGRFATDAKGGRAEPSFYGYGQLTLWL
jgi:hypothetical protein